MQCLFFIIFIYFNLIICLKKRRRSSVPAKGTGVLRSKHSPYILCVFFHHTMFLIFLQGIIYEQCLEQQPLKIL